MTIEDQSRVDIAGLRAFLERLREWQETPFEGDPMIDALLTYVTAAAHAIETLLTELEATRAAAERIAELEGALERLLYHYTQMVHAALRGLSDPEKEPEVIKARAALQRKEPGA